MSKKDESSNVRVFIDLEVGDQNESARQSLGYKLAQDFFAHVKSQVNKL
jgi:hypothetical protein